MHNEVGFLRVKPETSTAALVIAQNSGRHVYQLKELTSSYEIEKND